MFEPLIFRAKVRLMILLIWLPLPRKSGVSAQTPVKTSRGKRYRKLEERVEDDYIRAEARDRRRRNRITVRRTDHHGRSKRNSLP